MNYIYPNSIDNKNFKYILLDNKYIATICIHGYPNFLAFTEIFKLLENVAYDEIVFSIHKQDTNKILKDLSNNIFKNEAEKNLISKEQIDVDILNKTSIDAKNLRYEIQINNEEIYKVYLYILIKAYNKDEIISKIKEIQNACFSKRLLTSALNFRQLDGYLSTLLIENKNIDKYYKSMTTSNIVNMFPFYTKTIFDKEGILIGIIKENKNVINLDIFNEKYTNSNICVFGSSGSGKSFFIKLLILRHNENNIRQYIFDKEGEYANLEKYINAKVILKDKYINILDITNFNVNYVEKQIYKVYRLLTNIYKFKDEKDILNSIKELYKKLEKDNEKLNSNMSISNNIEVEMPVLEDLLIFIKNKKEFKEFLNKFDYLNKRTNIDINLKNIIFDFSNIDNITSNYLFKFYSEKILDINKNNKYIIYIDEVWKYLKEADEDIFNYYKTIRKRGGAIVTITQDTDDFFKIENYAKSIINNSLVKIFFKMDYLDKKTISNIGTLFNQDISKISYLEKGEMIMNFMNNNIEVKVISSKKEKEKIGGKYDYISS